jgi:hypothetical protein
MQTAVVSKRELPVRELFRDPALLTCAYGNILICFSGQTPGKSYMDGSIQAILTYAKDYPAGLGLLVLISADEPPPDEQSRRVILATRGALKSCVCGSVLVVEGEGFAASAKRSVIAMFSLSSSQPFPSKVAGTISEGSAKLAKMLGSRLDPDLDAESIAAVATSVRRKFA